MLKRLLLGCTILIACGSGVSAQVALSVNFVELLKQPNSFDGKRISVRATYRYGFEWQEIYCLSSGPTAKVWLAIPPELPGSFQKALRRLPRHQGTVNANFTGVFHGARSAFGDGGYQYQLDLEKIEHVEIVSRSGAVAEALPAIERSRVCQGTEAERADQGAVNEAR